jgi:hypothetical protein
MIAFFGDDTAILLLIDIGGASLGSLRRWADGRPSRSDPAARRGGSVVAAQ